MTNVKDALEFRGIVMSQVPAWAKKMFKELAVAEFDDHYGQTLATLIKESMEYRQFKELLLSNNLSLFPTAPQEDDNVEVTYTRKSINGNPIKLNKNGGKAL